MVLRFLFLVLLFGCRTPATNETKDAAREIKTGPARQTDITGQPVDHSLATVLTVALNAALAKGEPGITKQDFLLMVHDKTVQDSSFFCEDGQKTSSCSISTRHWPQLSPFVCTFMMKVLLPGRQPTDGQTWGESKSGILRFMAGQELACRLEGLNADFVFDFERPEPDLSKRPKNPSVVEEGAVGADGRPLPASSKNYMTELPSGTINLSSYRATPEVKKTYWQFSAGEERSRFEDDLPEIQQTMHSKVRQCSKEELYALRDYAGGTFHEVNRALRALRQGKVNGSPLESKTDIKIRMTASGINCIKQSKEAITFRGANLTEEQLARYQTGKTVDEPSFTSTDPGGVPSLFVGNVEFRIFDATGADLGDINPEREEGELLINGGTLMKVVSRELEGAQSIIYLHQIQ